MKKTTLEILCKEKSISLITWENSGLKLGCFNLENEFSDFQPDNQYESQAKLFKQFLFKSSRYFSEQIFSMESCSEKKNLLLVKETPNFAFYNVKQFQDILREYNKFSKFSLVFMFTTQTNAKGANPAKIFTSDIVKELSIVEISFNSFAITYIAKHIDRIAKLENLTFVDKIFLENLTATCNGDLRTAFNILNLHSYPSKENVLSTIQVPRTDKKEKTISKKETKKPGVIFPKKEKINFESNNKDITLNIFRCLGKVLYRKHLEPTENNIEKFNAEKRLPAHLKKFQTTPITCEPEEIYSKIPISEENFCMYLHQNYIEIFYLKLADQTFEKKFGALQSISEAFILADLLHARTNFSEASNSVSETKLKEIACVATIRSILFNFNKTQSETESKPKSAWMPLYKPFTHKIIEQKKTRIQQAEELLGKNQPNAALNSIYLNDINKEFFTTHLPFINLINTKKRGYIKDLGINESMLLFSKYKPVNSKTSVETDQSSFKENTASQQDTFELDQVEENSNNKKRPSSQTLTKTNDKMFKDEGIYESFEALSCIDEKF